MSQKPQRMYLVGVFGDPVDENPSYIMEEAAFRAADLNWRYLNLRVKAADLKAAVEGVRAMNFSGFNVTMPHKVKIVPLLDKVADDARLIGAVNTVWREGDEFIGENTDGKGFLTSLIEDGKVEPKGKRIVCMGAGGAGRAICVELALAGAQRILVVNRACESEMGVSLVKTLQEGTSTEAEFQPWEGELSVPKDTDILVHATPLGLYPNVDEMPPVKEDTINERMVVCDVIPNPPDTPFLRMARNRGAKTLGGLGMLVRQGAIAFEKWTGVWPSLEVMRESLESALSG